MSDDCEIWPGYVKNGYPQVWRNGNWKSVLRMVWTDEVPPGHHIYRTCDNDRCIRHLAVRTYLRPGWNKR